MSGFGSGFGSSQPPQQPTFGSQQASSQPQQFGGGFGSSPSGFGSSPPAPPSFGGGGFNAPASSPFGGSAAAAPVPSFGTSSNIAPSGLSGTGFGQAPSTFGTQSGTFGSPPAAAAPSFGSSSQNPTFPAVPVAQSTPQRFGAAPAAQAFGGGTPTPQPFGGTGPTTQPFGGSSTISSQTTTFGQTAPSAFGQAASPAPASSVASPFGNAPATSSSISFGVSANVVQSSSSNNMGVSNSATTRTFGSTSFPSSFQQAPSFGAATSSAPAFGDASDNEDMGDSGDFNSMSNSQQPPFGSSQQSSLHQPQFGTSQQPSWTGQKDRRRSRDMSPLPEQSLSPRQGSFSPPVPDDQTTKRPETEDEKLARLKAKIQEKKKKLLEQKKRKEAAAAAAASPTPVSSSLNPKAATFTPTEPAGHRKEESKSTAAVSFKPTDRASVAERNKRRFADSTLKSSQLPQDLKKEKAGDEGEEEDGNGNDRGDLENAVSLVGTCQHMCPDDELVRREQEGDIQLLEIPQPGTIHPDGWTLRDTAVKRFRRSAADFKLNVPEWVRPPEVLERVCAYLEEWVMERDRQGPDPRFTQVETPPPLDVYQFIWDRTRMVRKDFILQNYVGTGGNCDASAVRCHERIARWHAMCEHQLSHIPDFVTMQSQQNIQELGQTMKTLNMYYDDALGRSTVESAGMEGKASNAGCRSDFVMGQPPVDFNASPLENKTANPHRLIGANTGISPSRGTAEPEMRGLYILLTMDNDGGLEVLKYAGRLFRERPQVYNSKPVQLALSIYKAKKDYNYARFFSILRAPSTPYLFACIMFKYVQQMRKAAFRIMSKTYGAKRKDTGEGLYDLYPLKHLVRLLCFEDHREALEVCKHYNITVQALESSSGKSVPVVRWRHSEFRESKDPVKGTVVPIKPRKMVRTIEAKLKGATRLAVCRGDVSGEGASLSVVSHSSVISVPRPVSQEKVERQEMEEEQARAAALQAEQENTKRRQEDEARRRAEMERRLKEEKERQETEKQRQAQLEKERAEEAIRQELLRKKEHEAELARKKAEEEEKQKREAEQARIAALAAAEERRRQQQAEAERLAAEQEAARQRAEEEERERQRQHALRLKREEEQRLWKLRQEEEARKRREEEARRIRLLEIQRQREEEERKRKEEAERKKALEWERKINTARKLLFWRRLRRLVARRLEGQRSQETLSRIDPTYSMFPSVARSFVEDALSSSEYVESEAAGVALASGVREQLYQLKLGKREPLNLANILRGSLQIAANRGRGIQRGRRTEHSTLLCKLAVILPECSSDEDAKFCGLIHQWVDSRLKYGEVMANRSDDVDFPSSLELRTVAVNGNIDNACKGCDLALFIIPPRPESKACSRNVTFCATSTKCIEESTPRIALILDDLSDPEYCSSVHHVVSEIGGDLSSGTGIVLLQVDGDSMSGLDTALKSSCCVLLESFSGGYPKHVTCLDKVAVPTFARLCISDALWTSAYSQRTESGNRILSIARATLMVLVTELNSFATSIQNSRLATWPPEEFGDKRGLLVSDYFGEDANLPLSWNQSSCQEFVEPVIFKLSALLNGSFRYVIDNMLNRAPLAVRNECENLMDKKQFRRCLEKALLWRETSNQSNLPFLKESHIYLPKGELKNINEAVLKKLLLEEDVEGRDDFSTMQCSSNIAQPRGTDSNILLATMSDEDFVEETPALQSSPQGDNGSSQRALEYFGLETDLVPLERGAGDFSAGGSPFQSPSPLNFSSQKMTMFSFDDDNLIKGSKRSIDLTYHDANSYSKKRRKGSFPSVLSKEQQDSQGFTQKLEELLNGDATIDVDVGNAKLSDLLSNDVPAIELSK